MVSIKIDIDAKDQVSILKGLEKVNDLLKTYLPESLKVNSKDETHWIDSDFSYSIFITQS